MESSGRVGWWPILHLVVALAAIANGLTIVLVWVVNLALARNPAAMNDSITTMLVLGWVEIALSVLVIGGLATGAWLHRPLWARGVAFVILGMVLHWGWWLLDRRVDLFGSSGLAVDDPRLAVRLAARVWTMVAVDALAVLMLVLGGVLLLWHRPRAGRDAEAALEDVAHPVPDDAEEPAAHKL